MDEGLDHTGKALLHPPGLADTGNQQQGVGGSGGKREAAAGCAGSSGARLLQANGPGASFGLGRLVVQGEANRHDNLVASLNLYSLYRLLHSCKSEGG
jgi:hypothetical protein